MAEKTSILREHLGLRGRSAIIDVVNQAVEKLGLGAIVGDKNVVIKLDACLYKLFGARNDAKLEEAGRYPTHSARWGTPVLASMPMGRRRPKASQVVPLTPIFSHCA